MTNDMILEKISEELTRHMKELMGEMAKISEGLARQNGEKAKGTRVNKDHLIDDEFFETLHSRSRELAKCRIANETPKKEIHGLLEPRAGLWGGRKSY